LIWEGGSEFKKTRIEIILQKSENDIYMLYMIKEKVCYLCKNFEKKIMKEKNISNVRILII
jgi:thioredoxin-related protein